jgi:hypothetical protein
VRCRKRSVRVWVDRFLRSSLFDILFIFFAETLFADLIDGAPSFIPEPLGFSHTSVAALEGCSQAQSCAKNSQYFSLEAEALSMRRQHFESRRQLSAVRNDYDGLENEVAALNSERQSNRIKQQSTTTKQQLADSTVATAAMKSAHEQAAARRRFRLNLMLLPFKYRSRNQLGHCPSLKRREAQPPSSCSKLSSNSARLNARQTNASAEW